MIRLTEEIMNEKMNEIKASWQDQKIPVLTTMPGTGAFYITQYAYKEMTGSELVDEFNRIKLQFNRTLAINKELIERNIAHKRLSIICGIEDMDDNFLTKVEELLASVSDPRHVAVVTYDPDKTFTGDAFRTIRHTL